MQEIIDQVGNLMLGSVPTLILFLLLVVSYQVLVQGPLGKTLKERRARTSGAVEEAQKAIANAEAKTNDYAERLRKARAEVFKMREQRLQQLAQQRDAALEQARKSAGEKAQHARASVEAEAEAAKNQLQAGADKLAEQVMRAVLPAAAGGIR